jgi:hypothetical protein
MKSGSLSVVAALWLAAVSSQAAIRVAAVSSEPYPAAVGTDGRTDAVYAAEMMLDGNLETFACLLDDTRTGGDPNSRPPNGSLPVTGVVVFDLGAVHQVSGLELVSRLAGTCYLPRELDVFAVAAESVTPGMLAGADSDPRFRTVLSRHQIPASVVSGKGHVILFGEKENSPRVPERPERCSAVTTRFLGLRVRSSHTPVDGRHYNYQIAELRVLVLDSEGRQVVLTGQGQQPLETLPALAAAVGRAETERQGEDELAAAERRYLEQGLNATQPYPEARLHKDWIYQDHGPDYRACFTDTRSADRERRDGRAGLGRTGARGRRRAHPHCARRSRICRRRRGGGGRAVADRSISTPANSGGKRGWRNCGRTRTEDRLHQALLPERRGALRVDRPHHGPAVFGAERRLPHGREPPPADHRRGRRGAAGDLLETPTGIIRDPNVSYDGTQDRLLDAPQRHDDDDYHLYVQRKWTRPRGPCGRSPSGWACPTSSPVSCPTATSCSFPRGASSSPTAGGNRSRTCTPATARAASCGGSGYDQVHTNYPQTLDDGRVIYTRWEYNDRGQIFPQPLFVMNGDGTGQAEFYGGNSWFPTSILHARGIPGTQQVIGIASGHHTTQRGKLILVDRSRGTQEAAGIEYLAPRKPAEAVRVDQFGWEGEQFQYPYAFDEQTYLVTYCPEGSPTRRTGRSRCRTRSTS